ncbi:NAD kinase [Alkalihalobacillus trypoxylicola]|uniref:NAD kinase n=1 Tax=Alkalihalobacillus trypoxylicola TaxID=519424 RepID=A0A162EAM8_9BACI|nr:NAD kinase [Alkalihalobacillus trypoxylicola]KYG32169.1 NAD(+) kinase [Alkalihalobacillus trypoxylicola]
METKEKVYLFYKETEEMISHAELVKNALQKNGFIPCSTPHDASYIISIGGDNTFLQAIRKTGFRNDNVYLGVNIDQVGFYTDFMINDLEPLIHELQQSEQDVRRYPVLEVSVDNKSPFYCLNECSIRSSIIKTLVLEVIIDDHHFETFRGDGMIVSTPTGSTAYNKSVGGAIIDPKLPSMQVSEVSSLNNNEFRTLGTSFILGSERLLTLKVVQTGNEHPIIGVDNEALSIRKAKQVQIKLANRQVKVLKLKDNSFWHRVQRKFL